MRDQLAEQRRQLAEIERIRGLGSAAGGGGRESRGATSATRSHAVMPPSGAERPANHLQVNKIAQVCLQQVVLQNVWGKSNQNSGLYFYIYFMVGSVQFLSQVIQNLALQPL